MSDFLRFPSVVLGRLDAGFVFLLMIQTKIQISISVHVCWLPVDINRDNTVLLAAASLGRPFGYGSRFQW